MKNKTKGFWYWATMICLPVGYTFAKALGGKASREADQALEEMIVVAVGFIAALTILWLAAAVFRQLGIC